MIKKIGEGKFKAELEANVRACEAIRRDKTNPQDITLAEFMQEKNQISMEDLYLDLGLDPYVDTIQNIINMPDPSLRWLIPEIYRDALRLGLRRNPIYPNVIAGEQSVSQTSVIMPAINMSDAAPKQVGPAETILVGDVSFQQKTVKISKIGRGIKVPYEVIQYVSINLVAIFLQDFGVKLGMGIDSLMINTLLNGDQANGSDAISVLGVNTPYTAPATSTLKFRDLLKVWVRGGRLGKDFSTMIAGEGMAEDILDLFVTTRLFGAPRANVNVKTPIPQSSDVYVHGGVPDNRVIVLDKSTALIKLNAQPLLIESDKIISNQTQETYATLTTGFATIFKDSRVAIDSTLDFASNGFPSYMDPTSQENVIFN